jgi:glycosyltransferase involved in cell wall biosynthesis
MKRDAGAGTVRVLQVISDLEVGGAQQVVVTLARHLPDGGCLPVVLTFRDGPLRRLIEGMGITVEVVPGRTHSISALPRALAELRRLRRDLRKIVARHQIEVIQTHLLRGLDFLVMTLRVEPTVRRVFWTFHNSRLDLRPDQLPANASWLLRPKRVIYRLAYRIGARFADGLIAVSDDVARSVHRDLRPPRHKVITIPNGVELERNGARVDRGSVRDGLGIPRDAKILIVVAKLMEQKGHLFLLRALPIVCERVDNLQVVLAGEGPLAQSLAAAAADLGVANRVHFVGNRRDISDLLAASDLFVLPSLWEGLPMALLEAMASGLPVVATEVSGSREVVTDGETGWVVPPADAERLAEAIVTLLEHPAEAMRRAQAGRFHVERHYSARTQAARHAELFRH